MDKFTGNPFADDSDDEGGNSSAKRAKKSGSSDEYAGSLHLKEGRNLNNNLYYVDHTKLANNGNGLLPGSTKFCRCRKGRSGNLIDSRGELLSSETPCSGARVRRWFVDGGRWRIVPQIEWLAPRRRRSVPVSYQELTSQDLDVRQIFVSEDDRWTKDGSEVNLGRLLLS